MIKTYIIVVVLYLTMQITAFPGQQLSRMKFDDDQPAVIFPDLSSGYKLLDIVPTFRKFKTSSSNDIFFAKFCFAKPRAWFSSWYSIASPIFRPRMYKLYEESGNIIPVTFRFAPIGFESSDFEELEYEGIDETINLKEKPISRCFVIESTLAGNSFPDRKDVFLSLVDTENKNRILSTIQVDIEGEEKIWEYSSAYIDKLVSDEVVNKELKPMANGWQGELYHLVNENLILKYTKDEHPARFSRFEYENLKSLSLTGFVAPTRGISTDKRWVAIEYLNNYETMISDDTPKWNPMEDVDETMNIKARKAMKLWLLMFFHGISHNDFHGGNIMVNPDDQNIKLIDLTWSAKDAYNYFTLHKLLSKWQFINTGLCPALGGYSKCKKTRVWSEIQKAEKAYKISSMVNGKKYVDAIVQALAQDVNFPSAIFQ